MIGTQCLFEVFRSLTSAFSCFSLLWWMGKTRWFIHLISGQTKVRLSLCKLIIGHSHLQRLAWIHLMTLLRSMWWSSGTCERRSFWTSFLALRMSPSRYFSYQGCLQRTQILSGSCHKQFQNQRTCCWSNLGCLFCCCQEGLKHIQLGTRWWIASVWSGTGSFAQT